VWQIFANASEEPNVSMFMAATTLKINVMPCRPLDILVFFEEPAASIFTVDDYSEDE
jgi:hypothetical protein